MTIRVFQPVDKTVEITVQGNRDGQVVENKFYAKGTLAITSAMVAALAHLTDAWVAASYLPAIPNNYLYVRTIARDLTTEASFEAVDVTNGNTAGSLTGPGKPNNVTFAVHRDTGLSGKKAKSRIYWPAIADSQLSGVNTVSSAAAASMESILGALQSAIIADTSNTWQYGYVQRVLDHVKLSSGNFIEVIAHTVTDLILDSMRDRLPGHGV